MHPINLRTFDWCSKFWDFSKKKNKTKQKLAKKPEQKFPSIKIRCFSQFSIYDTSSSRFTEWRRCVYALRIVGEKRAMTDVQSIDNLISVWVLEFGWYENFVDLRIASIRTTTDEFQKFDDRSLNLNDVNCDDFDRDNWDD